MEHGKGIIKTYRMRFNYVISTGFMYVGIRLFFPTATGEKEEGYTE